MRMLMLWIFLGYTVGAARGEELFVVSYNVENLFDTVDDPEVERDEEFTPDGTNRWTAERLNRKLDNLAGVLKKTNANRGPDVFGVCEIENREVTKRLANAVMQHDRKYEVVHLDSPSGRGIDTAIVYDRKKMHLRKAAFHTIPDPAATEFAPLTTRFITEAEFALGGRTLTIFMNHWPAKANPAAHREAAAKTLRARLDAILAADAGADFLVMGDLNDDPTEPSVKDHLRSTDDATEAVNGVLYNTVAPLADDPARGTYVYRNAWETIDHILVSPGLLQDGGLRWKADSTVEIKFPEQIHTPADPTKIPHPNRSYSGPIHHASGISDHLPLSCVLTY